MQTFLPYPDFARSAAVLDNKRLGKQRVEAWQILRTLRGETQGWRNHPAVRMWRGYEDALAFYALAICAEWISRGFKDTMQVRFAHSGIQTVARPPWLGDPAFHRSHRAALLAKNPEWYGRYFTDVEPKIEYVWPV